MTLFICGTIFFLQSCAVNVYNWKGVPDDELIRRSSEQEKVEQYKKYAIDEIKFTSKGHHVGFSTYEEPDKTYDLYSYSPILTKYSPKSEDYFQSAMDLESAQGYTAYGYLIASSIYSIATFNSLIDSSISTEELQQNTLIFTVVSAASLLIYIGLEVYFMSNELEQYNLIKKSFNESLLAQFEIEKDSLNSTNFSNK